MTGAPIDLLYRLTQRDEAYPHWGPNYGQISITDNQVNLGTTPELWDASARPPDGTILFITHMSVESLQGDPAIGILRTTVNIRNRLTNALLSTVLQSIEILAPGLPQVAQEAMDLAIPMDRFFLNAETIFSAADPANSLIFNWQGYVTAQGSIGFV